jgi:hypothetical protein
MAPAAATAATTATTAVAPAATTVAATAAALMSNGATVIELRMMAVVVVTSFPRMVDAKAGIAPPAPPTPVWRVTVFRVAVAVAIAFINRKASASAAGDHSKQNECSDRADREVVSLL